MESIITFSTLTTLYATEELNLDFDSVAVLTALISNLTLLIL